MNPHTTLIANQGIFFAILTINGGLMYLLPRLTRPELYFAITVPPDFRDSVEGARILRRYRLEVWIHSCLAFVLVAVSLIVRFTEVLSLVGLFWQLLGCFVAYLRARWRVMPHAVAPATLREADLEPRPARLPGGWAVQVGPFAILAAMAVWLQVHWAQIPERFPVHWGFDGKPNGWATHSIAGVYNPLVVGAAVCAGVGLLAYGVASWTRRIQVRGGPGQSEKRFQRTMLSLLVATQYLVALLFAWVGFLALRSQEQMPSPVAVVVPTLAFTVLVIVVLVRMGQGGSRLPEYSSVSPPSPAAPAGDRTPDRYWIAGIFYVNRNDPAIVVEKRFGLGYTLNFGQPVAWIVIGLLVLVPVVLALLLRHH